MTDNKTSNLTQKKETTVDSQKKEISVDSQKKETLVDPQKSLVPQVCQKYDLHFINLDRRPDRLEKFKRDFGSFPFLNLIRFSAHYVEGLNNAIACSTSHYKLFKKNILTSPLVVVGEDDCVPTVHFAKVFPEIMSWAYANLDKFDYINLGTSTVNRFGKIPVKLSRVTKYLFESASCSAANLVIYNRSLERRFDNHNRLILEDDAIKKYGPDMMFTDWYFGNNPTVKRLISFPILGVQAAGYSDLAHSYVNYDQFFDSTSRCIESYIKEKNL